MNKDTLGNRMKHCYEYVSRIFLPRRMPLIIRIDGKAFHSYTNGFDKPFDKVLIEAMKKTAQYLCQNIEGCKMAYTQSDEISLLLTDYETFNTQPWFDKNLQKIVSVSASMATMAFNVFFTNAIDESRKRDEELGVSYIRDPHDRHIEKARLAIFDARAFVLPKEEVCNYFIWRQQDASRNSIQMVGHAYFSHKQLEGKNVNEIQDMLFQVFGVNWNDFPVHQKRGLCIVKEKYMKENVERSRWVADMDIPIFTQDRSYIDRLL